MRLLGMAAVTVVVASLFLVSGKAVGQGVQSGERRNLIGAWELVSLQDYPATGEMLDWMGKKPTGSVRGTWTSARTR